MSIDVNGFDNTPEWGYCKAAEGCREEAFPIWKSGDYPDDPDLLFCPKHLGLLIGNLSRQIGEQNTTIGYQDAMLARATADALVLRQALTRAQEDVCSLNCPSTWRTADGPPPHSEKCQAISALLTADAPGAALLAELRAARDITATLRRHYNAGGEVWGSIDRDFETYDAAVKGGAHARNAEGREPG